MADSSDRTDLYSGFKEELNKFVSENLPSQDLEIKYLGKKAIHDAIWGTSAFSIPELAIIDTPLLQRLRGIHQTAFAFFTYPCANHTRFDHTLGATMLASRFAEALNESEYNTVDQKELAELRLAALLHDVGHGMFSHVSEEHYKRFPIFSEIRKKPIYSKVESKPHEIMSHLIVTSEAFKDFFNNRVKSLGEGPIKKLNLNNIANMIIGNSEDPDKYYLSDIINGPFDIDKLDYIPRDSYYSGLKLSVDIDRLLRSLTTGKVITSEGKEQERLVLLASGVSSLEQILFSKMLLYSSIYHHQKIRATDSMLSSIVEYFSDNPKTIKGQTITGPVDFLRNSDYDLFNPGLWEDDFLKKIIDRIRKRRIFKRALIISRQTVQEEKYLYEIIKLSDIEDKYKVLKEIRESIIEYLPSDTKCSIHEIILDVPDNPSLREGTQSCILMPNGKIVAPREFFPTEDWLTAYYANKWKAHVFCPPEFQKEVKDAALEFFSGYRTGIKFNELAWKLAHIG